MIDNNLINGKYEFEQPFNHQKIGYKPCFSGLATFGWFHNDKKLLVMHGVVIRKTQQLSRFSQFILPMLIFCNLAIANPNNE